MSRAGMLVAKISSACKELAAEERVGRRSVKQNEGGGKYIENLTHRQWLPLKS